MNFEKLYIDTSNRESSPLYYAESIARRYGKDTKMNDVAAAYISDLYKPEAERSGLSAGEIKILSSGVSNLMKQYDTVGEFIDNFDKINGVDKPVAPEQKEEEKPAGFFGTVGAGIVEGAAGAVASTVRGIGELPVAIIQRSIGGSIGGVTLSPENLRELRNTKVGKGWKTEGEEFVAGTTGAVADSIEGASRFDGNIDRDSWKYTIASGLGSAIPVLATGGGLAALKVGGLATRATMVGQSASQLAGEGAADVDSSGNFAGRSDAVILNSMLGALDFYGGGISSSIRDEVTRKSIAKAAITGGIEEAVTETLQTMGQNYIASDLVRYDPDRNLFIDTDKAAVGGFAAGAFMNALMSAFVKGRRGANSSDSAVDEYAPEPIVDHAEKMDKNAVNEFLAFVDPANKEIGYSDLRKAKQLESDLMSDRSTAYRSASSVDQKLADDGYSYRLIDDSLNESQRIPNALDKVRGSIKIATENLSKRSPFDVDIKLDDNLSGVIGGIELENGLPAGSLKALAKLNNDGIADVDLGLYGIQTKNSSPDDIIATTNDVAEIAVEQAARLEDMGIQPDPLTVSLAVKHGAGNLAKIIQSANSGISLPSGVQNQIEVMSGIRGITPKEYMDFVATSFNLKDSSRYNLPSNYNPPTNDYDESQIKNIQTSTSPYFIQSSLNEEYNESEKLKGISRNLDRALFQSELSNAIGNIDSKAERISSDLAQVRDAYLNDTPKEDLSEIYQRNYIAPETSLEDADNYLVKQLERTAISDRENALSDVKRKYFVGSNDAELAQIEKEEKYRTQFNDALSKGEQLPASDGLQLDSVERINKLLSESARLRGRIDSSQAPASSKAKAEAEIKRIDKQIRAEVKALPDWVSKDVVNPFIKEDSFDELILDVKPAKTKQQFLDDASEIVESFGMKESPDSPLAMSLPYGNAASEMAIIVRDHLSRMKSKEYLDLPKGIRDKPLMKYLEDDVAAFNRRNKYRISENDVISLSSTKNNKDYFGDYQNEVDLIQREESKKAESEEIAKRISEIKTKPFNEIDDSDIDEHPDVVDLVFKQEEMLSAMKRLSANDANFKEAKKVFNAFSAENNLYDYDKIIARERSSNSDPVDYIQSLYTKENIAKAKQDQILQEQKTREKIISSINGGELSNEIPDQAKLLYQKTQEIIQLRLDVVDGDNANSIRKDIDKAFDVQVRDKLSSLFGIKPSLIQPLDKIISTIKGTLSVEELSQKIERHNTNVALQLRQKEAAERELVEKDANVKSIISSSKEFIENGKMPSGVDSDLESAFSQLNDRIQTMAELGYKPNKNELAISLRSILVSDGLLTNSEARGIIPKEEMPLDAKIEKLKKDIALKEEEENRLIKKQIESMYAQLDKEKRAEAEEERRLINEQIDTMYKQLEEHKKTEAAEQKRREVEAKDANLKSIIDSSNEFIETGKISSGISSDLESSFTELLDGISKIGDLGYKPTKDEMAASLRTILVSNGILTGTQAKSIKPKEETAINLKIEKLKRDIELKQTEEKRLVERQVNSMYSQLDKEKRAEAEQERRLINQQIDKMYKQLEKHKKIEAAEEKRREDAEKASIEERKSAKISAGKEALSTALFTSTRDDNLPSEAEPLLDLVDQMVEEIKSDSNLLDSKQWVEAANAEIADVADIGMYSIKIPSIASIYARRNKPSRLDVSNSIKELIAEDDARIRQEADGNSKVATVNAFLADRSMKLSGLTTQGANKIRAIAKMLDKSSSQLNEASDYITKAEQVSSHKRLSDAALSEIRKTVSEYTGITPQMAEKIQFPKSETLRLDNVSESISQRLAELKAKRDEDTRKARESAATPIDTSVENNKRFAPLRKIFLSRMGRFQSFPSGLLGYDDKANRMLNFYDKYAGLKQSDLTEVQNLEYQRDKIEMLESAGLPPSTKVSTVRAGQDEGERLVESPNANDLKKKINQISELLPSKYIDSDEKARRLAESLSDTPAKDEDIESLQSTIEEVSNSAGIKTNESKDLSDLDKQTGIKTKKMSEQEAASAMAKGVTPEEVIKNNINADIDEVTAIATEEELEALNAIAKELDEKISKVDSAVELNQVAKKTGEQNDKGRRGANTLIGIFSKPSGFNQREVEPTTGPEEEIIYESVEEDADSQEAQLNDSPDEDVLLDNDELVSSLAGVIKKINGNTVSGKGNELKKQNVRIVNGARDKINEIIANSDQETIKQKMEILKRISQLFKAADYGQKNGYPVRRYISALTVKFFDIDLAMSKRYGDKMLIDIDELLSVPIEAENGKFVIMKQSFSKNTPWLITRDNEPESSIQDLDQDIVAAFASEVDEAIGWNIPDFGNDLADGNLKAVGIITNLSRAGSMAAEVASGMDNNPDVYISMSAADEDKLRTSKIASLNKDTDDFEVKKGYFFKPENMTKEDAQLLGLALASIDKVINSSMTSFAKKEANVIGFINDIPVEVQRALKRTGDSDLNRINGFISIGKDGKRVAGINPLGVIRYAKKMSKEFSDAPLLYKNTESLFKASAQAIIFEELSHSSLNRRLSDPKFKTLMEDIGKSLHQTKDDQEVDDLIGAYRQDVKKVSDKKGYYMMLADEFITKKFTDFVLSKGDISDSSVSKVEKDVASVLSSISKINESSLTTVGKKKTISEKLKIYFKTIFGSTTNFKELEGSKDNTNYEIMLAIHKAFFDSAVPDIGYFDNRRTSSEGAIIRFSLEDSRRRLAEQALSDANQYNAPFNSLSLMANNSSNSARNIKELFQPKVRQDQRTFAARKLSSTYGIDRDLSLAIEAENAAKSAVMIETSSGKVELEQALVAVYKKPLHQISNEERQLFNSAMIGDTAYQNEKANQIVSLFRNRLDKSSASLVDRLNVELESRMASFKGKALDELDTLIGMVHQGSYPKNIPEEYKKIVNIEWLIRKINSTKGRYIHRAYSAFSDPEWYNKVSGTKEYSDAVDFMMRTKSPSWQEKNDWSLTSEEVRRLATVEVEKILSLAKESQDPITFFVSSMVNNDFLKQKNNIPPEIRALLGEIKDPVANYVYTKNQIEKYVAIHENQERVKNVGMDLGIYTESPTETNNVLIEGDAYPMLEGLYTSRANYNAYIEKGFVPSRTDDITGRFIAVQSAIKFGKTVVSPTTISRNIIGGYLSMMTAGHPMAFMDVGHAISVLKNGRSTRSIFSGNASLAQENAAAMIDYYARLGVIGDSIAKGEMTRLLKDVGNAFSDQDVSDSMPKQIRDKLINFYSMGDDVWKIVAFESEKKDLLDAGVDPDSVDTMAAERIRDLMPTYSKVPELIQQLRLFPLVGTFVSFPWEVMRNLKNSYKIARDDYNSGRTALANKRVAGLALGYALPSLVIAPMLQSLFDIDDDDKEVIEMMSPRYEKGMLRLFTGNDNGVLSWIDGGALVPSESIIAGFRTALQSGEEEGVYTALTKGSLKWAQNFLGIDMTVKAAFNILSNYNSDTGRPIYGDGLSFEQVVSNPSQYSRNVGEMLSYAARSLLPGVLNNITDFYRPNPNLPSDDEGIVSLLFGAGTSLDRTGREYTYGDATAALLGFRQRSYDMNQMIMSSSQAMNRELNGAKARLRDAVDQFSALDDTTVEANINSYVNDVKTVYQKASLIINYLRKTGMDNNEIVNLMYEKGNGTLTKKVLSALINGNYPAPEIGDVLIKRSESTLEKAKLREPNANWYIEEKALANRLLMMQRQVEESFR